MVQLMEGSTRDICEFVFILGFQKICHQTQLSLTTLNIIIVKLWVLLGSIKNVNGSHSWNVCFTSCSLLYIGLECWNGVVVRGVFYHTKGICCRNTPFWRTKLFLWLTTSSASREAHNIHTGKGWMSEGLLSHQRYCCYSCDTVILYVSSVSSHRAHSHLQHASDEWTMNSRDIIHPFVSRMSQSARVSTHVISERYTMVLKGGIHVGWNWLE